jgi:integrase
MCSANTRMRKGAEKLLSDRDVTNAKPAETPYKLSDGGGLHLEVRPNGARLWRYRYRLGGKENMFAIGAYPEVSLAEAREDRDAARKLVKHGVHPSHKRRADRLQATYEHANTLKAVALEWLEAAKPHWTPRTYRQRLNLLTNDVFPHVGALPMRQVTSAHAHAILMRIQKRAPQMAAIARQCFSSISQLAITTMRADVDIGYPLRNALKLPPTVHKTPLRVRQIPGFFKALDAYAGYFPTKSAIRLMWWTLARPKEVVDAAWAEFDLEHATWTIPAERMKMRQPHTVPLPEQAVQHLKLLRAVTGSSPYIFPSRATPKRHASHMVLSKAFNAMGYEGKFSPHGVRVTGRTILGEQGHPKDVLERQLAHREKKEVRAYDQGDRLEARRVVMQGWADYLDSLCAGVADNVVNINSARA